MANLMSELERFEAEMKELGAEAPPSTISDSQNLNHSSNSQNVTPFSVVPPPLVPVSAQAVLSIPPPPPQHLISVSAATHNASSVIPLPPPPPASFPSTSISTWSPSNTVASSSFIPSSQIQTHTVYHPQSQTIVQSQSTLQSNSHTNYAQLTRPKIYTVNHVPVQSAQTPFIQQYDSAGVSSQIPISLPSSIPAEAEKLFQKDAAAITAEALENVKNALGKGDGKGKGEQKKKGVPRAAAGQKWEDPTLTDFPENDHRLFCGDLGNEVNDDVLAKPFIRFPSYNMARVIRDKRTGKTKGYGFVSFGNALDAASALKEINGKYVGNRPIKIRKSTWKERTDTDKKRWHPKKQKKHLPF